MCDRPTHWNSNVKVDAQPMNNWLFFMRIRRRRLSWLEKYRFHFEPGVMRCNNTHRRICWSAAEFYNGLHTYRGEKPLSIIIVARGGTARSTLARRHHATASARASPSSCAAVCRERRPCRRRHRRSHAPQSRLAGVCILRANCSWPACRVSTRWTTWTNGRRWWDVVVSGCWRDATVSGTYSYRRGSSVPTRHTGTQCKCHSHGKHQHA